MITFDISRFLTAAAVLFIGFFLTAAAMPRFIKIVRRIKFGQEVRDDGPQSHLKKQGTPTMGGAVFALAAVIACMLGMLIEGRIYVKSLQIIFLMAGFGLIGAADDYLKIAKHNTDGLNPKQKLILQLIIAAVLAVWVYYDSDNISSNGRIYIPFTGNFGRLLYIDIPLVIFVPFAVFVILGSDNGVNFTDGLDGLCGSVTAVTAAMFAAIGLANGETGLMLPAAGILGALLGFLIYNVYPAKIFMGDTGSLALGGFVAASAVVSGMELYIPVFGLIYLIEVVSVIIQVLYFKKTGGKRFFKMAPIHHHFELLGNSETRITAAFSIVTMLLCILTFIGAVCV